jgi:UDP:flavonoid glycosyltransferase YjiC (YdhE family)
MRNSALLAKPVPLVPIDFEHHAQTNFKNMPFTFLLNENNLTNYSGRIYPKLSSVIKRDWNGMAAIRGL